MSLVDGDILEDVAPRVAGAKGADQSRIIAALNAVVGETLDKYAIDTRLRGAHFLAQACEESDGFCATEEYASGEIYEGRSDLGNTHNGDGRLFKGRGLFQLTGRSNYDLYGRALGLDLIANPALAAEPANSLLIACEYWRRDNLNELADKDDLIAVTRKINGGLNGIGARRSYLAAAKTALARVQSVGAPMSVLRRGSRGDAVVNLQARLRLAGYPLAIDGDCGPATELAVLHFQK